MLRAALAALLTLASCSQDRVSLGDDQRGPLPERDRTGSCDGHCGGKSDGNCWCDDACGIHGDCCSDKTATCGGTPASCAALGAECLTSLDPTFPPSCEAEFGRDTIDATCPRSNQSCCL
jgi:hypothetical protein